MKNNIEHQYVKLVKDVLDNGIAKQDRTGTGTLSVFGRQIRHDMAEGFPLLTTKKMAIKSIATELKWFLKGRTDLRWLLENNCNIWTGDAYANFLRNSVPHDRQETIEEFADRILNDRKFNLQWGNFGEIYGAAWRNFEGTDQIARALRELRTNPDSRRIRVSAWNPAVLDEVVLPPCHTDFQLYTRELSIKERVRAYERRNYIKNIDPLDYAPKRAISLMFNMRSTDIGLGLPFNIASYAILLEMFAEELNMVAEELVVNLGDAHIYNNHIPMLKEQIRREIFQPPLISLSDVNIYNGDFNYKITDYVSHPKIEMPLSN